MSQSTASKPDPAPVPPTPPGLDDCCRSGCTPCVFDLYEDAMDRYRAQLAAWQARQRESVVSRLEKALPAARGRRKTKA